MGVVVLLEGGVVLLESPSCLTEEPPRTPREEVKTALPLLLLLLLSMPLGELGKSKSLGVQWKV